MKKIFLLTLASTISIFCLAQKSPERMLKEINLSGEGYELGQQHGSNLKEEINGILTAWKENTTATLLRPADEFIEEFFEYANFDSTIVKLTPKLYEEIKGIADGSEQEFKDILVLNLLDEFWVYINNLKNHHCSGFGIPSNGGTPSLIAQNMDLENFTDGYQVLMRLQRTPKSPEQLILTYPGLIALNGMNEKGIGVCVNTLMQLSASNDGLPVAFFIRKILSSENEQEILDFVTKTKHASGQNYIIGYKGRIYDFEASANKVIRYEPENGMGIVYHTNHPLVNNDLKSWFSDYHPDASNTSKPKDSNSYQRFQSLEKSLQTYDQDISALAKNTLRAKDNALHPVCRSNNSDGKGFTFASTIMHMGEPNYMEVLAGPPNESEYIKYYFTKPKKQETSEGPE